MDDFYPWLFDHYALPQLTALDKSGQDAAAAVAAELSLDEDGRIRMADFADGLRLQWGTEAFALGVRLGLALYGPRGGVCPVSGSPCAAR